MKKQFYTCIATVSFLCLFQLKALIITYPEKWEHPQALSGPRKSSYPYISGDTFRAYCDFVIDEKRVPFDTDKVKDGSTIFLNADSLEFFFTQVHPHITKRYILVTHNSDCPAPGAFASYLDDPKLIAWFGQNGNILHHPKFFHIPIGIANRYWSHGDIKVIDHVIDQASTSHRDIVLYLNQSDGTNKKERSLVRSLFGNKSFCHSAKHKPFKEYLTDLTHAQFVVCPAGNGLDCHRQWEVLLMGAIPVMLHSTLDPLFGPEGELPVVLVDDWSHVTEEFLKSEYQRLKSKTRAHERMFAGYWLNKIAEVKQLATH